MDSTTPENSVSRRRIPKWAVILVACIAVLVAVGVARHFYLVWKEHKVIRAARIYLDQGRSQELQLALEVARSLNPRNVDAARLSARAALKDGNPNALIWLRRAVELAPGNLDDKLALVSGALRFGKVQEGVRVLKEIEPKAAGRADFQDLAGRAAQMTGASFTEAETRYAEAVRLDPGNASYRMHLAITRLASPDAQMRDAAAEEVEKTGVEPSLRAVALRALVVHAVKKAHIEKAVALATELDAQKDRVFADRLIYLEVLRMADAPDFQTRLDGTEKEAEKNPSDILDLLRWMNGNNLSLLARDWVMRLPATSVSGVETRMEMARTFLLFGDWKKLRFFLASEQWGERDYIRRAYLARCSRELETNERTSKLAWAEAINSTSNRADALFILARLAIQWKWDDAVIDALWQAAKKSDRSTEALSALGSLYYKLRQTAGLFQVYSILINRSPNDPVIRNNFAIFCLLMDKDKAHALSVARDLYEKEPTSPVYASTFAFALYCTGDKTKAVEVMQKLKPEELKDPSTAAYYSAFLAAVGKEDQARPYRELARQAVLLPEEARLLNLPQSEASVGDAPLVLPEPMSGEALLPSAPPESSPTPAPTPEPSPAIQASPTPEATPAAAGER